MTRGSSMIGTAIACLTSSSLYRLFNR